MTKVGDIGTLKMLDVKVGDVVEHTMDRTRYEVGVRGEDGCGKLVLWCLKRRRYTIPVSSSSQKYKLIDRVSDTPKLWRNMTDAEKGAILIAWQIGKAIEFTSGNGYWSITNIDPCEWYNDAYRIKPEPKVEVVTLNGGDIRFSGFIKGHKITFNTIDGKPDVASVKMEAL